MVGEFVELVPEGLGADLEPRAGHPFCLPRQRQVVEVFVRCDLESELGRVASRAAKFPGAEGRLDMAASTPVLLASHLLHHEFAIDDIDQLAFLALIAHLVERVTTVRTDLVRFVELAVLLDLREVGLGSRADAFSFPATFFGRALLIAFSLLGARPELHFLELREMLLDGFQLALQAALLRLAEFLVLRGQHRDPLVELFDLGLLQGRDLSETFWIVFCLEIDVGHDDPS